MGRLSDKAVTMPKALGIPEILETIFKNLDIQRLKLCRRVCLTWCNEISRTFLTRIVPRYAAPAPWPLFQELLDAGKGLRRLLCPFQEMYTVVSEYSQALDLINRPFLPAITRLTLSFEVKGTSGDAELTKHTLLLLQSCSKTLTHLRTYLDTNFWNLTEEIEQSLMSFHFAQLKALWAVWKPRTFYERPVPSAWEFKFFLLVISSAPKLSDLELDGIACTPKLLGQATFKNIEKLRIRCPDNPDIWTALSSFDSDKLKSIDISGAEEWSEFNVPGNFYSRYSSTLEYVNKYDDGPWKLSGRWPNVRRLDFDVNERLSLSSFPALREVGIISCYVRPLSAPDPLGISRSQPSRTVRAVHIDYLSFSLMLSGRRAVLAQLLQLFPCATDWRINSQSLPDFCRAVEESQCPPAVQKLGVALVCFFREDKDACFRSRGGEETAQRDLDTFSSLHLLKVLRELELHQKDNKSHSSTCMGGEPRSNKPVPFNVSTILFRQLPQLGTLRIFSRAAEFPQDLEALKHLNITTELIVAPGSSSSTPNWSDPFLLMKNVTMHSEQTGLP